METGCLILDMFFQHFANISRNKRKTEIFFSQFYVHNLVCTIQFAGLSVYDLVSLDPMQKHTFK